MKKDYINNIEGAERRFLTQPVELRSEGDEQYFEGMAAVYDSPTDLGYFSEEIRSGAFKNVMGNDVRGLFNHDSDVLLGRTASGTMVITETENGLHYKIRYNPNDPDHVRVMEKIKRGDVSQSSFAFTIKDEEWATREGKDHRVITEVHTLYDVSPVTYPAYADTTVAARSLEALKTENNHMVDDDEERNQYLKNYYNLILK